MKEFSLYGKSDTVMNGEVLEECGNLRDVRTMIDISQSYWFTRMRTDRIRVPKY